MDSPKSKKIRSNEEMLFRGSTSRLIGSELGLTPCSSKNITGNRTGVHDQTFEEIRTARFLKAEVNLILEIKNSDKEEILHKLVKKFINLDEDGMKFDYIIKESVTEILEKFKAQEKKNKNNALSYDKLQLLCHNKWDYQNDVWINCGLEELIKDGQHYRVIFLTDGGNKENTSKNMDQSVICLNESPNVVCLNKSNSLKSISTTNSNLGQNLNRKQNQTDAKSNGKEFTKKKLEVLKLIGRSESEYILLEKVENTLSGLPIEWQKKLLNEAIQESQKRNLNKMSNMFSKLYNLSDSDTLNSNAALKLSIKFAVNKFKRTFANNVIYTYNTATSEAHVVNGLSWMVFVEFNEKRSLTNKLINRHIGVSLKCAKESLKNNLKCPAQATVCVISKNESKTIEESFYHIFNEEKDVVGFPTIASYKMLMNKDMQFYDQESDSISIRIDALIGQPFYYYKSKC